MIDIPKLSCPADYVYKETATRDLKLTFLPPLIRESYYSPVLFLIPGGGWHNENRASMINFAQKAVDELRRSGFAVVSIDYRVYNADRVKMPQIVEDCFDALEFIIKNASALKIDHNKIITCGHSSGGHLALMLAYCDGKKFGFDFNRYGCRVKAVAALSPVTVLYDKQYHSLGDINDVFEEENAIEQMKEFSPVEYVSEKCPATLIAAGELDNLVHCSSSEVLHEKLVECGVSSELLLSLGAGHSFENKGEKPSSLTMDDIQNRIIDFALKQHLG